MHMGTRQEIFTCAAKQGSIRQRREPGGGVWPCALACNSSAAPRGRRRVWRERKNKDGVLHKGVQREVFTQKQELGELQPWSVIPGAAQCAAVKSPGSSEPLLPKVGNGRKGENQAWK